jgi:transposase
MSKKTKTTPASRTSARRGAKPAPAPGRASSGRRSKKKQPSDRDQICKDWEIKHPDAAGIDIGTREHWVSVGPGRDEASTRRFGTCTPDLDELITWLQKCRIKDVAMESTGMYWLPVYERLEEAGFAVILVDARQTRHTAGRKSDLLDCEWIRQLHMYGLLRAAFRPTDAICRLRTLQRHRKSLVEAGAECVQHMHKALDGMNLHVHHALSDLTGESGMAMLEAIEKGERDPQRLAALANRRVKKTPAQLTAALTGNYREEELFVLQQALASYRHFRGQIAACEEQVCRRVEALEAALPKKAAGTATATPGGAAPLQQDAPAASAPAGGSAPEQAKGCRARKRSEKEQSLALALQRIFGVDLTVLPGLGVMAVLTLLSELGTDMSRWRHAKAFASWLGLCPNHRISGGRVLSAHSRKVVNRAATAFRMAALTIGKTDTPLGCFYRRKAAQFGAPKAITATARKLACLVYEMVRTGQEYRPQSASAYQKRYDEARLKSFCQRAKELGYGLVKLEQAA